jgi:hypothetical protein
MANLLGMIEPELFIKNTDFLSLFQQYQKLFLILLYIPRDIYPNPKTAYPSVFFTLRASQSRYIATFNARVGWVGQFAVFIYSFMSHGLAAAAI